MTTVGLRQRTASALGWASVACLLCSLTARPETLRVATWDLRTSPLEGTTDRGESAFLETATGLRTLQPHVVLLRGINDQERCARLIEALKPTRYTLALYTAVGNPESSPLTNLAGLEDLKRTYQSRVATAQADLLSAQRALGDRQAALGPLGRELVAQGAMDWPEVPAEKVSAYLEITRESDKLRAQERELLRRGYKDAHPLVQTVRTLLRNYSTQRAELEREFPTVKYLGNNNDLGTNTTPTDIVGKLAEIHKLKAQVTTSGNSLSNVEFEASRILSLESKLAEAEQTRIQQERARLLSTGVAILTRQKVENFGSEPWSGESQSVTNGMLGFATIQFGEARVALISVAWSKTVQSSDAIRRVLNKVDAFRRQQGTPQTFVVGLSGPEEGAAEGNGLGLMTEAGFMDSLRDLSTGERAKLNPRSGAPLVQELFTGPVGYALRPQVICGSGMGNCFASFEVELDQTKTIAALPSTVQSPKPAPTSMVPRTQNPSKERGGLLLIGGVTLAGLLGITSLSIWRYRAATLKSSVGERALRGSSAYTLVLAPKGPTRLADGENNVDRAAGQQLVHVKTPIVTQTQSASWERRALQAEQEAQTAHALIRQGLLPELSRWLKQKLVRKLITDRTELLSAQQVAVRQVAAVDERLARIEAQIHLQNRAYVRRIEELTAELQAAKAENRELIKARIAQVKTEMEAAREKLLKEESEGDPLK